MHAVNELMTRGCPSAVLLYLAHGRGAAVDILHVIFDDLRPDLGAYGRRWARTPHLDALADSGVIFTQAHAAVANCAPSRASFLTGRRPDWNGVLDLYTHHRDADSHVVTLPQALRESEKRYLTVSYGKVFHQGEDDPLAWAPQAEFADHHTCRGIRRRPTTPPGSPGDPCPGQGPMRWNYHQYHLPGLMRGRGGSSFWFERGPDANPNGVNYTDYVIADQAREGLERLAVQPRPWYLAVGFVRPHLPFNSPASFFDAFPPNAVPPPPRRNPPSRASVLTANSVRVGEGELNAKMWKRPDEENLVKKYLRGNPSTSMARNASAAYAAAVSFADAQFGRVMNHLATLGLRQTTAIVVHSDHGWKLGHLGGWGKHSPLTQDTHVPLIISVPGALPGRIDSPVELLDVFPTIIDLAGVSPRHSLALHGRSLRPTIEGRQVNAVGFAVSQWPQVLNSQPQKGITCMGYSLRIANWTLVQWVLTPTRCSRTGGALHCLGPRRDTPGNAAAWKELERRFAGVIDPCSGHADLFRAPPDYGVKPWLEPESRNVIDAYPQIAKELRELLILHLHLDRNRVAPSRKQQINRLSGTVPKPKQSKSRRSVCHAPTQIDITIPPLIIGGQGGSGTRSIVLFLRAAGVLLNGDEDMQTRDALAMRRAHLTKLDTTWKSLPLFRRLDWNLNFCQLPLDVQRVESARGRAFARHILQLIDAYKHLGNKTWGWKEPRNIFHLPLWQAMFPKFKFLHIVRDVRTISKVHVEGSAHVWRAFWDDDYDMVQKGLIEQLFASEEDSKSAVPLLAAYRALVLWRLFFIKFWCQEQLALLRAGATLGKERYRCLRIEDLISPTAQRESVISALLSWSGVSLPNSFAAMTNVFIGHEARYSRDFRICDMLVNMTRAIIIMPGVLEAAAENKSVLEASVRSHCRSGHHRAFDTVAYPALKALGYLQPVKKDSDSDAHFALLDWHLHPLNGNIANKRPGNPKRRQT